MLHPTQKKAEITAAMYLALTPERPSYAYHTVQRKIQYRYYAEEPIWNGGIFLTTPFRGIYELVKHGFDWSDFGDRHRNSYRFPFDCDHYIVAKIQR